MPRRTAAELRQAGFEAVDVRDVGLKSHPDEDVLEYAQAHQLAIITRDKWFASEPTQRGQPFHGVILIRVSDNILREPIISLVLETVERLQAQPLGGMIVIAAMKRTRLRQIR